MLSLSFLPSASYFSAYPAYPNIRSTRLTCLARKQERKELRERKRLIGSYVRRLAECDDGDDAAEVTDGCPADAWVKCARTMRLLDEMREQGLPVSMHATNAAMRSCSYRLDVVEQLFAELKATDTQTEGSYAALMHSRVVNGELAAAAAALDDLLGDERLTPKLRTCSRCSAAVRVGRRQPRRRRGAAVGAAKGARRRVHAARVRRASAHARPRRRRRAYYGPL